VVSIRELLGKNPHPVQPEWHRVENDDRQAKALGQVRLETHGLEAQPREVQKRILQQTHNSKMLAFSPREAQQLGTHVVAVVFPARVQDVVGAWMTV